MMALKTVTKLNISKNAPLSVELKDAMQADQAVMYERNKYEYVDNDQTEIDMAKAQAVADKFADFTDVTDQGDNNNNENK
jgi:recombination protein RecT